MTTVQKAAPALIKYSSVVFGSLSLLGSTYIFTSSIIHKRLRSFSFRMVLWMCVFSIILSCATICGPLGTMEEEAGIANEDGINIIHQNIRIGNDYESSLPLTCKLQAAAIQFSIFASLLWSLCFAIHLFRISSPNVDPHKTHSYTSLCIYLSISIPVPLFMTYYIFAKNIVGVSSDFWCWIDEDLLDEWSWKMLYIEVIVMVTILLILYFVIKCHLKRFIKQTNNDLLNNADQNYSLMLNRSRLLFVRTISSGLSSYLVAPTLAFIPGHFNYICALINPEWKSHVLSWYILSALLLGVLQFAIYVCGISIVRHSWSACCEATKPAAPNSNVNEIVNDNDHESNIVVHNSKESNIEYINRSLQQSQKHYMELV